MERTSFDIVPLAFDFYTAQPPIPASAEADAVVELLGEFGGRPLSWDIELGRDLNAVDARLRTWRRGSYGRNSLLLWFGHGWSVSGGEAKLLVPGEDEDATVNPATLADHIAAQLRERGEDDRWTFVVIEACGAKRFIQLLVAELSRRSADNGLVVIGSGEAGGSGWLGTFRHVLAEVVAGYTDNDREIGLSDLCHRIDERLEGGVVRALSVAHVPRLVRTTRLPEPVTASVDVYDGLRALIDRLPDQMRSHFARRGMGAVLGELSWNFVGRRDERTAIAAWLAAHDGGLLAVTGAAGSGKSAILGNVLLHSQPEIGEILDGSGFLDGGWTGDHRLPRFDLSLHLTGATSAEVAAAVADAAGVVGPAVTLSASERADALAAALAGQRLTIMADALDESQEPFVLAALFRQLAGLPGVRIVLGTRSASTDMPDAAPPDRTNLLTALGCPSSGRGRHEVLWVKRAPDALAAFIRGYLERLRPATGVDEFEAAVDRVVRLAQRGNRQFLFAGLAVREILADPGLLDTARRDELETLLSGDHQSVFAAAVKRLTDRLPFAADALAALAHARGRGLPRADRIWATAASAVGGAPVGDKDLGALLTEAAPYVMLDAEGGQSVYRLAHRTFQEFFLAREHGETRGERARRLSSALLQLAEENTADGGLNPYLAHHLSGHLSAVPGAGLQGWLELDGRPAVLDRLDPRAVAADAFGGGRLGALPDGVVGAVVTAHLAERADPADRASFRELGTLMVKGSVPAPRVPARAAGTEPPRTWRVSWGRGWERTPHLTLSGHRGPVRAMCAFTGADGSPLLATGGDDGTVRIWDPHTGHAVFPPLTGHRGPVVSATPVAGPGGLPLLVTTAWEPSARHSVRIWNTATGMAHDDHPVVTTPECCASGLAIHIADGRTLVVLGGYGGPIYSVDPLKGRMVGKPMTGHSGAVRALATLAVDGTDLLVSAGHDGTVRQWDPRTGKQVSPPLNDHESPVLSITATDGSPEDLRLVGILADGRVVHWRPAAASEGPIGDASIGPIRPLCVTAGRADGIPFLAVGGHAGALHLRYGRDSRAVLRGHDGGIHVMTSFRSRSGATLLASGGDDHSVRIWDVESAMREATPPAESTGDAEPGWAPLTAVRAPDGSPVLLCTGHDRVIARRPPHGREVRLEPATEGCWSGPRPALDDLARDAQAPTSVSSFTGGSGGRVSLVGNAHGIIEVLDEDGGRTSLRTETGSAVQAACGFVGPDGRDVVAYASRGPAVVCVAPDRAGLSGRWEVRSRLPVEDGQVEGLVSYYGPENAPRVACLTDDGTVTVWDPLAPRLLHTIPLGLPGRDLVMIGDELAVGMKEGFVVLRLDGPIRVGSRDRTAGSPSVRDN